MISYFIISQILVSIAMVFDFLSLQYKKREHTFLCLIVSASLISTHYFLLSKATAGFIVLISVFRFIACYFTTDKRVLILFLILNTLALVLNYKEISDFIIYIGLFVFIIGNFIADNKLMRKVMMIGTSIIIVYNTIIFSPMGAVMEGSFLLSNFIGYYRHYIKVKSS
ncbi:MAG: YgjV family protein [Candidatus Gracilibacteria bacterium]|nr:YgjV family protein [Candidatus Gracilibacteria bacterium]MDD3120575.1 YgjV family protein [Candidatus Gracilibacteria bacterium]MDD4530222.1 YgjV family protein [Candidatus Gracilibacteria bacterium]